MLRLQLPVSSYYLCSFKIWMAITVVFPIAGNVVTPCLSIVLVTRVYFCHSSRTSPTSHSCELTHFGPLWTNWHCQAWHSSVISLSIWAKLFSPTCSATTFMSPSHRHGQVFQSVVSQAKPLLYISIQYVVSSTFEYTTFWVGAPASTSGNRTVMWF